MTKLKEIRGSLGLSQVELCAKADVSIGTLMRMERDDPSVTRLSKIKVAKALKIPAADLFPEAGDGSPK